MGRHSSATRSEAPNMDVKRTGIILKPTNSRVVIRPFEVANENRIEKIIARVASLSEPEVERLLETGDAGVPRAAPADPRVLPAPLRAGPAVTC